MKYCSRCGNQLNDQDVVCNFCGTPYYNNNQGFNQQPNFADRYQPQPVGTEKKSNKGIFVVLAIIVAAVLVFSNFSGKIDGMSKSEINDYKYYDNNKNLLDGDSFKLDIFKVTIPKGYTYTNGKTDEYILASDEKQIEAAITVLDGTIYNAMANKESFIEKMVSGSTNVNKFEIRKMHDKNILVVEAQNESFKYYMLATQVQKEKIFLITVIQEEEKYSAAIDDMSKILVSAKKE